MDLLKRKQDLEFEIDYFWLDIETHNTYSKDFITTFEANEKLQQLIEELESINYKLKL